MTSHIVNIRAHMDDMARSGGDLAGYKKTFGELREGGHGEYWYTKDLLQLHNLKRMALEHTLSVIDKQLETWEKANVAYQNVG